jgi:CheY-like chemotaxis protein
MTISILIATDNNEQAQKIVAQLAIDYEDIVISISHKSSINDFDKHQPDILILAFANLAIVEQYYDDLYQSSSHITICTHRTLLLCHKDDLNQAHELCKQETYDDYILFWPEPYDNHQLPRTIHHATLSLEAAKLSAANAEITHQVRRLTNPQPKFETTLKSAYQLLETIKQTIEQIKLDQTDVLTSFLQSLSLTEFHDLIDNSADKNLEPLIKELQENLIYQHLSQLDLPLFKINKCLNDLQPQVTALIDDVRLLQVVVHKSQPTVLIVDDDKFTQMLINDIVSTENYSVLYASSGIEALKTLRKHKPDIILMDMKMPTLDGVETIRRIKDSPKFASIPIIMVTGNNAKKDVIESLKAGAADFVFKPISHGILLDKMEALLN